MSFPVNLANLRTGKQARLMPSLLEVVMITQPYTHTYKNMHLKTSRAKMSSTPTQAVRE